MFVPVLLAARPKDAVPVYRVEVKDEDPDATPFKKKYSVFPDLVTAT